VTFRAETFPRRVLTKKRNLTLLSLAIDIIALKHLFTCNRKDGNLKYRPLQSVAGSSERVGTIRRVIAMSTF